MVLTPDRRTLIVAETTMNRLTAFDVAGGCLGQRRMWAAFGGPPTSTDVREMFGQLAVAPDGICLDAEGAVWVADALHGRLLRVAEGGRILEERHGEWKSGCSLACWVATTDVPCSRALRPPSRRPRRPRTIVPRS